MTGDVQPYTASEESKSLGKLATNIEGKEAGRNRKRNTENSEKSQSNWSNAQVYPGKAWDGNFKKYLISKSSQGKFKESQKSGKDRLSRKSGGRTQKGLFRGDPKCPSRHSGAFCPEQISEGRLCGSAPSNRKTWRDNGEDVGKGDHFQQEAALEETDKLGRQPEPTGQWGHSCSLRDGNGSSGIGASYIFKAPVSPDGEDGNGQQATFNLSSSNQSSRREHSNSASNPHEEGALSRMGDETMYEDESRDAHQLEGSRTMGRDSRTSKGAVYTNFKGRNNNRLGNHTKGPQRQSVLPEQMGRVGRGFRGGNSGWTDGNRRIRNLTSVGHITTSKRVEGRQYYENLYSPLDKKRRNKHLTRAPCGRMRPEGRADKPPCKALDDVGDLKYNNKIRRERNRHRSGPEDILSDEVPIKLIRKMGAQFTHRAKSTRIPSTSYEKSAPLHAAIVQPMDIQIIKDRMLPSVLERFNETWDLTFKNAGNLKSLGKNREKNPPPRLEPALPNDPSRHSSRSPSNHSTTPHLKDKKTQNSFQKTKLSCLHSKELVRCKIAVPFKKELSKSRNVPFTVFEERETGDRQRFILWTKEENEKIYETGYEPFVPLQHISKYLGAVHSEVASLRDFKTGFYQILIPEASRPLFTFEDALGDWFALTRLPMGHVCAPEIMNTITAVVSGDPLFVRPEFAEKLVKIDWWIDNIRIYGDKERVREATNRMDEFARLCNATWKVQDTVNLGTEYEFLGAFFSHPTREVSLGEKITKRIKACNLNCITAAAAESLSGRLLHASAISGVPPGRFWFAMKFLRRLTNKLNRGAILVSERISLPNSVKAELRAWMHQVQKGRTILPDEKVGKTAEVFIDASLKGWGGVIVWDSAEMEILGGQWPLGEERHINILEADALGKTLSAITRADHLSIWVDNTTVCGSFRKKMCARSHSLNSFILVSIEKLLRLKCSFTLQWVSTKYNPADIPSREPITSETRAKVELALGDFFNSRRGGGAGVTPNRNGHQPLPQRNKLS